MFCDNDIENGRRRELFRGLFASGDLEIAFAVMEAHPDEILEQLKRMIQTFAGHKRKCDLLLNQTEREALQRALAKRVTEKVGRDERAR